MDGEETFLLISNRRDWEPNPELKSSDANHYPRHDFDDELKISSLILSFVARSKTFFWDLISGFCTNEILCTLSRNLERIVSILSTIYLEKLSRSDFTDLNSGRGGGGTLCRMLFIEFHRLSVFSEITSAKCFDLAFVIILLHTWH